MFIIHDFHGGNILLSILKGSVYSYIFLPLIHRKIALSGFRINCLSLVSLPNTISQKISIEPTCLPNHLDIMKTLLSPNFSIPSDGIPLKILTIMKWPTE